MRQIWKKIIVIHLITYFSALVAGDKITPLIDK